MPKYENKCPKHFEMDLYSGCPFGCRYCVEYAKHAPRSEQSITKEEFAARYIYLNAGNYPVYLSPETDAYQPLEKDIRVTRSVLDWLTVENRPFFVITKGTLVERDRDLFAFRKNAFIACSINSLDPDIISRMEPGAPPIDDRKECAELLAETPGVRLVIKIDPVLPGLTDGKQLEKLIDWLKVLKPYAVTAETLRLSEPIFSRMRPALTKNETRRLCGHYQTLSDAPGHAETGYRIALFSGIAKELTPFGIRACFCRASLPEPVTEHDCRGGYA